MTLQIGILLALALRVRHQPGFLYKHRGPTTRPAVSTSRTRARSAVGCSGSKWFAIGMAVAVGAWGLHVAALAMAPMSVVQAVLAGGVVLLAVMAERLFGFSVGRRQWSASG